MLRIGGDRKQQRPHSYEQECLDEPAKGARKLAVWGIIITAVSCDEAIRSRTLGLCHGLPPMRLCAAANRGRRRPAKGKSNVAEQR